MSRSHLINAFIIHRRDFRDTSLIIDFFTEEYGVISAVAKGAKRPKSQLKTSLHYFSPLLIDCYGKNELLGLKSIENNGPIQTISGKHLLTLLYVNELLNRLLHKHEPHPAIFSAYKNLVLAFASNCDIEISLRNFEMLLLQELGYGLSLDIDGTTGIEVCDSEYYHFHLEDGLKPCVQVSSSSQLVSLNGAVLKKIQQRVFEDKEVRAAAKFLFRQIFNELLQFKPLNSRQLFNYMKTEDLTDAK